MNYTRRGLSRFRNLPDLFAFSEKMRPSGYFFKNHLEFGIARENVKFWIF